MTKNSEELTIDTPASLSLLPKKMNRIGSHFIIANKVELINLTDKSKSFSKTLNLKRSKSSVPDYFSLNSRFHKTRSVFEFDSNKPTALLSAKREKASSSLCSILYTISVSSGSSDHLKMSASSSTSSTSGYTFVDPTKIHLFVKAGQDGRSQGACPFCQDVFMQLLIKAHTNKFNFDVITINLDNPPKEFKELSIKPPVLIHGSSSMTSNYDDGMNAVILSDVDEIAEYLDRLYPNSELTIENSLAKKVSLNVFSKFSFFIRDVSSKSTNLELELEKIDQYLKMNTDEENKFLNGKTLTALDCSLLPKLQHIRVAAESIKQFSIPYRFTYLWRYIKNAYQSDAFQKSCPPDREIIWHWLKTNHTTKDLFAIMQETPYKTLSIPEDLKLLS